MKRALMFLVLLIAASSLVAAKTCDLSVKLINQDPYPAVPGDYVKAVFQLEGMENPECGTVTFALNEKFPFSLDPGVEKSQTFNSGIYQRNYGSFIIIPYKIRVGEEALDGANPLEVSYSSSTTLPILKEFEIEIKDIKTDFELSIDDYDATQNKLVFSILNIGKNDVESVVVEVPKQENIEIKGGNKQIIGSLNSNDDTTFSFEAIPTNGDIKLLIYYTDKNGVRRSVDKKVAYDPSYFTNRKRDEKSSPTYLYVIGALVLLIIIWRILAYRKKKNKK